MMRDLKEFLMKEYEEMWSNWKFNYESRDRWIRLYFIVVSIIFGLFGLKTATTGEGASPILSQQHLFPLGFSILFVFGLAIFLNDIVHRKSRVEFTNAINRIRKAFKDTCSDQERNYIYLDTNIKKNFLGKRDPLVTWLLAILTSVTFSVTIHFVFPNIPLRWLILAGGGCLVILICVALSLLLMKTKGNQDDTDKEVKQNLMRIDLKKGFFRVNVVFSVTLGLIVTFFAQEDPFIFITLLDKKVGFGHPLSFGITCTGAVWVIYLVLRYAVIEWVVRKGFNIH